MEKYEKPILATNLDGFLIDHSAFIEPHRIWFDRAILLTKDDSLKDWKGKKDYFKGVNIAMEKVMPNATSEERTKQARDWYQEDIIHYISIHPEVIKTHVVESIKKLKEKFTLALITTNTRSHIEKILKTANLEGLYDIIEASDTEKEPNKAKVFKEFRKKYTDPKYYIASRSKEAFETFPLIGTTCIYFQQNGEDTEIKNLAQKTIASTTELEAINDV